ncbi:hypothetical protein Goshw_025380 [Gossypium schwendimanii]|uniref:Uncharacterized protein n=1 Tax=Gossypium schwendimanii TaxID=34291 RepID=A0A7J9LC76_GOSSC|nr:hypothetical protein [Gossypium schwendimanii]
MNHALTLHVTRLGSCGHLIFETVDISTILIGLLDVNDSVVAMITSIQWSYDLHDVCSVLTDFEACQNDIIIQLLVFMRIDQIIDLLPVNLEIERTFRKRR